MNKTSIFSSFKINDADSCKKAIRNGGIAAMISASVTTIFGIIGFFNVNTSNSELNYYLDPWILLDAGLFVFLGIFVFKKSRIASTLLLVIYLFGKISSSIELGTMRGAFMTLIFVLYFFTAMRATYLWHSKYKEEADRIHESNAEIMI